ncbi:MAG: trypsin-like peptidase domain-containing protein [Holophagales bacterium]|jgi:S1-C subfamily serine protease|nr:trypsin-like peptidase domain-containing protein [Holophagales bacterium]
MRRSTLITIILAAGILAGWCGTSVFQAPTASAYSRPVDSRGPLLEWEKATIQRFKEAQPSVVYITTIATVQRDWFGFDLEQVPAGSGSGFIWDTDGHIVTNYHVIQRAEDVLVTLYDRSQHQAKLIGLAPEKDLAILKIGNPPSKLHPIPIGTSHDLQVGQSVIAIGNPFGFDQTLTTGVVSALGREIQSPPSRQDPHGRSIMGVIQTDAAINPGNSGGPLLDSAGRLIGVNTQIASSSKSSAGVGFAIPVDTVNKVVPQLISRGRTALPDLGFEAIPERYNRRLGLKEGQIAVLSVRSGGSADRADLRPANRRTGEMGDVITSINGSPASGWERLQDLVYNMPIGSTLQLEVQRNNRTLQLKLQVDSQ